MTRLMELIIAGVSCAASIPVAHSQVLWKERPPLTTEEWTLGPWGPDAAPKPPFHFLKENLNGTNAKVEVSDAKGRRWTAKFGGEVHSDVFAARLAYALGYAASPTYYVSSGAIVEAQGLKRAKFFVSHYGAFHTARFKLKQSHKDSWSWADNPFNGSPELGGLKVLVMLLSNWDTKDDRDGEGGNNGVFDKLRPDGVRQWFAVTDWGASLGKTGGFFTRARWDWRGYREQTPGFVKLRPNGSLQWGFDGKHGRDITAGVGIEDVRWLLPRLLPVKDEQLVAGLESSGASPAVARHFAQSIRMRIQQLQYVAGGAPPEMRTK